MITAAGVGSGLDIESLVTQLVAAERSPVENRLARQDARLTAELSGFGLFKGALSSFQAALTQMNGLALYNQRASTSSNEDAVAVSAGSEAVSGDYKIGVTELAQAHSLATGSYASAASEVGTGTLTIRFGTTDYQGPDPGPEAYNSFAVNADRGVATIEIDSSNNTLEGIRDAINAADAGVSAAVVNDGSGFRLLLSSAFTGAENSLEIDVVDTGDANNTDAAGLSALSFNSAATQLEQTVAARDASFSVNGLAVTSASNTVSDVIEGLDLSLLATTAGQLVDVSVSEDKAAVRDAVTTFVNSFNSFASTTANLTAYDPATGNAGALQGDFSVRSVSGQVRQLLSAPIEGFDGAFQNLSEIGIRTQADGSLAVDDNLLNRALDDHFDDIVGLFAAVGFPSDPAVEYVTSSEGTQVGDYALEVTRLASRSEIIGAAIGFPLTVDADNDSFSVKVDGVSSGDISLTQGSYADGQALAAELQARINGDAALRAGGVAVTVEFVTGQLQIRSQRYGSGSQLEVLTVDTNTTAQLGLAPGSGAPGQDVAGTIGGVAAIGTGQVLKAASGSAAQGLEVKVTSGALGARGDIQFSRGLAYQLDRMITGLLETDGALDARTAGIQDRIDDIVESRDDLDRRMEILEARYRAQFTALDTLLSQLQTTSDFLTQQLAALPGAASPNNNNSN